MKVFSGNANPALAKDIVAYLGINLGKVKVRTSSVVDHRGGRDETLLFYLVRGNVTFVS